MTEGVEDRGAPAGTWPTGREADSGTTAEGYLPDKNDRRQSGQDGQLLFVGIQGRLEALVYGNLVAGDELVGLVGHANDGLEFLEHIRGHALGEG